jgi:hypothetical protein
MSGYFRSITLQDMPDVIRILNESTRGTSLEYNLDFVGFMSLWRYWNFSSQYSFIGSVENEPSAIVLTSIDPEERDAYTFFWGALPKFRTLRVALSLAEHCCQQLHNGGYATHYADSLPERPVRRYRLVRFLPQHEMVDLTVYSPSLPARDPGIEIRRIDVDAIANVKSLQPEPTHWSQRHKFFRNIAPYLHFIGAYSGNDLKAYAVISPKPANTGLLDLRSPEHFLPAGYELIRYTTQEYAAPISATYVSELSYAHRVLSDAGFTVTRRFFALSRDLRTTC